MPKKNKDKGETSESATTPAAAAAPVTEEAAPAPAPVVAAAAEPAPAPVTPVSPEPAKVSQESRILDDKLGALKDQIAELRSSIKNFETELDARLDACFKSILAQKGAESGVV
jgi:hypothetical protein